jgi:peptidoglycan/LPS O-acetylase OafA/YrhL
VVADGGEPRRRAADFAYQPALDGVRAIAVAMVLLFHAGFEWMSGGYVGVSLFFTLSGYLITSLALVEHERNGRLDVGAFYARRVRRLAPASMACLVGVVVLAALDVYGPVPGLRRDLWAALTQVYNWVALASGTSYEEQVSAALGRRSPLDHYWSLAIEEQFYWVWPLVLAVALPRLVTATRRVVVIAAALAASTVAAPLIAWRFGADAAYWASPARLAEILAGAALAVVSHERRMRFRVRRRGRAAWLAVGGLVVVMWAATTWPAGSGPAYAGWLPAFALGGVALIAGLQVDSPLRRALSWRPLVALGAISYGVYLYHWPIYAAIDETRLVVPRPALFAVRLVLTLAAASVSYAFLERPVRRSGWTWRPLAAGTLVASAAVAVVVALAVPGAPQRYWEVAANSAAPTVAPADREASLEFGIAAEPAPERAREPAAVVPPVRSWAAQGAVVVAAANEAVPIDPPAPPTTPGPTSAASPADPLAVPPLPAELRRPVRILVVGDSTASATGIGLLLWAAAHPELAQVHVEWSVGCGFLRRGEVPARTLDFEDECDALHDRLPATIARFRPDVVMPMVTTADLGSRSIDGGPVLEPGDDGFGAVMAAEYTRNLARFREAGVAHVAWVIPPTPDIASHPEHYEVLRGQIEAIAASAADVDAVDLAAWDAAQRGSRRPDGLHYSPEAAAAVAEQFLAPTLISIALS